jgi:hypothetical protein
MRSRVNCLDSALSSAQSLEFEVPEDPRSWQRLSIKETSNIEKINKIVYQIVSKV